MSVRGQGQKRPRVTDLLTRGAAGAQARGRSCLRSLISERGDTSPGAATQGGSLLTVLDVDGSGDKRPHGYHPWITGRETGARAAVSALLPPGHAEGRTRHACLFSGTASREGSWSPSPPSDSKAPGTGARRPASLPRLISTLRTERPGLEDKRGAERHQRSGGSGGRGKGYGVCFRNFSYS